MKSGNFEKGTRTVQTQILMAPLWHQTTVGLISTFGAAADRVACEGNPPPTVGDYEKLPRTALDPI